jgi:hypothetical protein
MDKGLSSRLIESVLMNVPIPVIYLSENENGDYDVIDGQQRLTSFISFIEGKLPNGNTFDLNGLAVLDLNKKKYIDLPKELQTKIQRTTVHTIIIKKDSNEDMKFEIFERLNTGSVKLNEDELRNSVYRGNYINLLAKLEDNKDFHFLVKKENFKKRLIYRGMILRFLALSEKSYINYKPSMKQFSNKELRDNRNLTPEKAKEYEERFKHCVDLVKLVFGEKAFRRFVSGTEEQIDGNWVSSRINMALFDIQMCCFVNYSKNQIVGNADLIKESLLKLMSCDQDFIDSILLQTSGREQ